MWTEMTWELVDCGVLISLILVGALLIQDIIEW